MYKKRTTIYLITFLASSLSITGLLSIYAMMTNFPILKLWKEIIMISFIVYMTPQLCYAKFSLNEVRIILFFLCLYLCYILYNIGIENPSILTFYQIKNDFIVWVFGICLYFYLKNKNKTYIIGFSKKTIKVIIFFGLINAFAGFWELYNTDLFLGLLGFTGDWTNPQYGVQLMYNATLRPIGLQLGFVPYSTLMLVCYILVFKNSILDIKLRYKIPLGIIFAFAIITSTYYTAQLGLLIFVMFQIFELVLYHFVGISSYQIKKMILPIMAVIFLFLAVGLHTLFIYDMVDDIFPDKAYGSIYVRVLQHREIIESTLDGIFKLFFGIGFGINGVMGLDTSNLSSNIGVSATDSTYAYMLSNYGWIGVFLFLTLMIYLIKLNFKTDMICITFLCLYALVIEFFFNNLIADFPINILFIYLISLNLSLKRKTYKV